MMVHSPASHMGSTQTSMLCTLNVCICDLNPNDVISTGVIVVETRSEIIRRRRQIWRNKKRLIVNTDRIMKVIHWIDMPGIGADPTRR